MTSLSVSLDQFRIVGRVVHGQPLEAQQAAYDIVLKTIDHKSMFAMCMTHPDEFVPLMNAFVRGKVQTYMDATIHREQEREAALLATIEKKSESDAGGLMGVFFAWITPSTLPATFFAAPVSFVRASPATALKICASLALSSIASFAACSSIPSIWSACFCAFSRALAMKSRPLNPDILARPTERRGGDAPRVPVPRLGGSSPTA